jgi:hypothetical protein
MKILQTTTLRLCPLREVFFTTFSPLELRQIRKNTEFDYIKKIGYDKY